jgi:hypothetical protein
MCAMLEFKGKRMEDGLSSGGVVFVSDVIKICHLVLKSLRETRGHTGVMTPCLSFVTK